MPEGGKCRPMYKPCDPTQNNDLNYELWNTRPTNTNTNTEEGHPHNKYHTTKNWVKQGIDPLPKTNPKDKNERFELSENQKNY